MKSLLLALLWLTGLFVHTAFGSQIPLRHVIKPDLPSVLSNELQLRNFNLPIPKVPESLDFEGFTRSYLYFYSGPKHDMMTSDFIKTSGYWSMITAFVINLDHFDPPITHSRPIQP